MLDGWMRGGRKKIINARKETESEKEKRNRNKDGRIGGEGREKCWGIGRRNKEEEEKERKRGNTKDRETGRKRGEKVRNGNK